MVARLGETYWRDQARAVRARLARLLGVAYRVPCSLLLGLSAERLGS